MMRDIIFSLLENKFFRNSIVLFSGTMVVNVLNYVFHLVVGRMVSPSAYGEIESLVSLLAIISVPAGTLTLVATKYAAEMKARQDAKGTEALSLYFNRKIRIYGLPLLLLAILLTPLVRSFLNIEASFPVLFLWVVMTLSFLSAVTIGLLTGWQRFADINKISVSSALLKLLIVLILLQFGWNVHGVWGGLALASIFGYLISIFFLRKLIREHALEKGNRATDSTKAQGVSMRKYAASAFYGTLSMAILGNADMIFAKHHLEASVSGEYGALSVAAKTIFFITGVLTTVLFAMSAEESNQNKKDSHTFRLALWLTLLVASLSIAFFSLFPEFVIRVLFGGKYLSVSYVLPWFALAAGIYSLANLFLQYLLSLHETRATFFFLALSGLEIAALFFLGESLYAIIGITVSVQVLATFLGLIFVIRRKRYVEADFHSHPSL